MGVVGASGAGAHAVLVASNPAAGSALDSAPTAITLTFSEQPEPALTTITMTGPDGASVPLGDPTAAAGDALSASASVPEIGEGVYTVTWRVVSRVDGHPTAGVFAFGVGITPEQAQAAAAVELTFTPRPSAAEVSGRWLLLGGLVAMLGATCAGAAGFAGPGRGRFLAAVTLGVSVVGLSLLSYAQRASAAVPWDDFLSTSPGRAVQLRAAELGLAGAALVVAALVASKRAATIALWFAAGATAVTIAIHVGAGHAAAGSGLSRWVTMGAQWAHFAAAGVWLGGLAALLIGLRGDPSADKASVVRRFSTVAAAALAVVVVAGVFRAVVALEHWGDLFSSGYGQAVVVKTSLLGGLVVLGLLNRRRSVPAAATTLSPLRRVSGVELVLATMVIAATAALTSLSPPVDVEPLGLTVDGVDQVGSLRAELTTAWDLPGPNDFEVRLREQSGEPVEADRVTLRFVPLDDPGIPASTLELGPGPSPGTFSGSGQNLTFAGRWEVSVVAEEGAESRVVHLEMVVEGPPIFLSVSDFPGQPVFHTVQLADGNLIRLHIEVIEGAPDRYRVEFFNRVTERLPVTSAVLTATDDDGLTHQLPLTRVDATTFVSTTDLVSGQTRFAVVARDERDERLYGTFDFDVEFAAR